VQAGEICFDNLEKPVRSDAIVFMPQDIAERPDFCNG
jgi:hypothetical protein